MPRDLAAQQSMQEVTSVGIPVGGLNSVSPYGSMAPEDCLQLVNMIPSSYGRTVRLGSVEWQHGVPGSGGVRTVLPFLGVDPAKDKLFAVSNLGIYNVTTIGGTPTSVQSFAITTASTLAGYGSWCSFSTVGDHYLVYCDEANGLFVYTESTGTWSQPTQGTGVGQIDGVDPATFVFPIVWQNRLWFIQRSTSDAWYLPVGQMFGTAKVKHFGNNLRYGGELKALAVWTVSGGVSAINNLVVMAASGEIVVWTGTDPDTAGLFTIVGTWYTGGFPNTRHIALDSGGDVLIMSAIGLVSLAKLLQGATVFDRSIYETWKIDNQISVEVANNAGIQGWNVCISPDESAILLTVPQGSGVFVQYAASLQTKGWCRIEGRPMQAAGVWHNHLYFGTAASSSSVWLLSGGEDGILLNGTGGTAIDWFFASSFQGFGQPSRRKRVGLVRTSYQSGTASLALNVGCKFDYDLSVIGAAPAAPTPTGSLWDVGQWDVAQWDGGPGFAVVNQAFPPGTGMVVSVQVRGKSTTRTVLTEVDVLFDSAAEGGL